MISPVPPQRILLIRLKGIGDVILSSPLFRALRKAFPQAEIHLLTRSACEPMVRHNPHLNGVLVHPGKNASLGEMIKFIRTLRAQRYDWVLDLAAEPRSAWLTFLTGASLRAGYAFRVRKWAFNRPIPKNQVRKYQVEVNLDILRALGVPDDGSRTEIFLGWEEKDWAEERCGELRLQEMKWKVALSPTGTWSAKRWPVLYWRELIGKMNGELGVKPLLLGGPGDKALLEEIRAGLEEKTLVDSDSTLLQAAALLSKMDLVVGTDGTPQHIAQAFGVPSLTLFGPTWGISWTKPDDPRHRYLQEFLDCGPCDRTLCPFPTEPGKDRHVHQECLLKIPPEKVFRTALEMLKSPESRLFR